jgi:hypothetical protein
MRASTRFRAALQIGQRQCHFISWNRTTKETGSELVQAIALKGQNCYSKKRNTDQHHAATGTEETKTVKNRDANGKFKNSLGGDA